MAGQKSQTETGGARSVEELVTEILTDMAHGFHSRIIEAISNLNPLEQAEVLKELSALSEAVKQQIDALGKPKEGNADSLILYIQRLSRRVERIGIAKNCDLNKETLTFWLKNLEDETLSMPISEFSEILREMFKLSGASQSAISRSSGADRSLINYIASNKKERLPAKWTKNMLLLRTWCIGIIKAQIRRIGRSQ